MHGLHPETHKHKHIHTYRTRPQVHVAVITNNFSPAEQQPESLTSSLWLHHPWLWDATLPQYSTAHEWTDVEQTKLFFLCLHVHYMCGVSVAILTHLDRVTKLHCSLKHSWLSITGFRVMWICDTGGRGRGRWRGRGRERERERVVILKRLASLSYHQTRASVSGQR